jgi:predicted metal-binding membrane protein
MHSAHPGDLGFAALTAMWLVMMTAMMAPAAWPWIGAFRSYVDRSIGATASFSGGYLSAWLMYALAAASIQIVLQRAAGLDPAAGLEGVAGAAVLVGAGLYQFAPLKRACLTHCRSPVSYFLARWRNRPPGGFRLGFGHGLYCVVCCWALMATTVAVGMTNLWWMLALAVVVFVEQAAPGGDRLRLPLGAALTTAGVWRFL